MKLSRKISLVCVGIVMLCTIAYLFFSYKMMSILQEASSEQVENLGNDLSDIASRVTDYTIVGSQKTDVEVMSNLLNDDIHDAKSQTNTVYYCIMDLFEHMDQFSPVYMTHYEFADQDDDDREELVEIDNLVDIDSLLALEDYNSKSLNENDEKGNAADDSAADDNSAKKSAAEDKSAESERFYDEKIVVLHFYEPDVDKNDAGLKEELGYLRNLENFMTSICGNHMDIINSVIIASENGVMLDCEHMEFVSSNRESIKELKNYDYKNTIWYKTAMENAPGEMVVTTGKSFISSEDAMYISTKYETKNGFSGVLCSAIDINTVEEYYLENMVEIDNMTINLLLDSEGYIMASSKESGDWSRKSGNRIIDTEYSLDSVFEQIITGGTFSEKLYSEKLDENFYLSASPVEELNWKYVIIKPEKVIDVYQIAEEKMTGRVDEILENMDYDNQVMMVTVFVFIILFCIVLMGIAIITSILISKNIVRPVVNLTNKIEKLDHKTLNFEWEYSGRKTETAVLGDAFKELIEKQKQYIEDVKHMTAEKERMTAELDVAARIQQGMLPKIQDVLGNSSRFDIKSFLKPAKEVGGDFYDFFMLDDENLCFMIADVSSKGIPAAMFMTVTKTLLKNNSGFVRNPGKTFERVNNILCEGNDEAMFVTAWLGIMNTRTGLIQYSNAGHNPPVVVSGTDAYYIEQDPGFVLAGFEDMEYVTAEIQLKNGDRIFLYTDGITEAQNDADEQYGEDRLLESLKNNNSLEMPSYISGINSDISAFVGAAEQFDDMTMLVIEYRK